MKGRFLDAVIAAGRDGALGGAGDRHQERARSCCSTASAAEGDLALDEAALGAMRDALRADRNRLIETAAGAASSSQVFSPPRRCFVIGAVHIAQPLVRMLTLADYQADRHRPARLVRDRGAVSRCRTLDANGPTRRWSG